MKTFLFRLLVVVAGFAADAAFAQTAAIPGVVEVFSDQAEYQGDRSVFSGNVTLAAGQMTLVADRLEVQVGEDGNLYRADGNPVRIQCGECFGEGADAQARSVQYDATQGVAVAAGDVRVCSGVECRNGMLSADELEWRRGEDVLVARGGESEGVKPPARLVWSPPDGEAVSVSAREIEYNFRARTALFSGDAEALRGGSSLRGEKIFLDRETGSMRAESAAEGGRVRAIFGATNPAEKP